MTTTTYKGFRIRARPYQTHVARQWTVDLEIHRRGQKKPFSLNEHYSTQQEAENRCMAVGRRIIDRDIDGWSVDSLRTTGLLSGHEGGWRHFVPRGRRLLEAALLVIAVLTVILVLSGTH